MLGRKVLDAVERGVGDAVEVLDAVDAEIHEVARGGFADGHVHRGRQLLFFASWSAAVGLVAIHRADDLDAVGAALLGGDDERADFAGDLR